MEARTPKLTLRLPADAFEEIEPLTQEDGTRLRRYRVKGLGPDGPVATEVLLDAPIELQQVARKPLKIPEGSVFFADYGYPSTDE